MTPENRQRRERLLELLRTLSYARRPVVLASGKSSDFYIDTKQAVLSAEGHFCVGQLFYGLLEAHAARAEAIGGLTMGADPLASATSLVSFLYGKPRAAFYIRKEPKGHGTREFIEGAKNLRAGMPVGIVEDVITTGGSTIKAIERANEHKLEVVHVLALVDREEENGRQNVERYAPVTALFSRRDFLT